MVDLNSSVITQPWNMSVVSDNGTNQLRHLVAPAWVSSPNVRGSMDILRSCILTLVACIYTALHLDVPRKTTWQYLLMRKTKYVLLTLFAPEMSVFAAMQQLRYAWKLRSALQTIQRREQEKNWTEAADFEINLKYALFIVMGAVRFDVHDILSVPDLDDTASKYFEDSGNRRNSVRPGPGLIVWLAERGHWFKVRKQDIDDKSKADTLQKVLVLIQVSWMVIQCIARRASDLPLSLLEIHTMLHVVCAIILYACWFQKPLDVMEAIVVTTEGFKGEVATQLQREFYINMAYSMVLFPAKQQDSQAQPTDIHGEPMRWIIPEPQADMKVGDMLPSGLALYTRNKISRVNGQSIPAAALDSNSSFKITNEFLRRWASILTIHPFEERESLTERPPELDNDPARLLSLEVNSTTYLPGDNSQPLYVGRLTELQPGESTDWNRPFWEGKSIVHVDLDRPWQSRGILLWMGLNETHDFGLLSPLVTLIAMLLTGVYGGVHMVAWGWSFPTFAEEVISSYVP
ncbi:hypothetical protein KAF25_005145 [Fusarium avenaceum]|uniref:Uncharacterized protein n=1 Tax=Fusarium avenaceum TaxID=40199 RepID=A0A9P7HDD6_9HYPO|nr:hypothetical protein KAF25_005145 [Fusarium avenaceum]